MSYWCADCETAFENDDANPHEDHATWYRVNKYQSWVCVTCGDVAETRGDHYHDTGHDAYVSMGLVRDYDADDGTIPGTAEFQAAAEKALCLGRVKTLESRIDALETALDAAQEEL